MNPPRFAKVGVPSFQVVPLVDTLIFTVGVVLGGVGPPSRVAFQVIIFVSPTSYSSVGASGSVTSMNGLILNSSPCVLDEGLVRPLHMDDRVFGRQLGGDIP